MQKVSSLADFLFKNIIIYIICLIWARFYIENQYIALLASMLLTIIISLLFTLLRNKRYKKLFTSKTEEKHIKACINQFVFSLKSENVTFFYNLALKKYNAVKKDNCIFIKENDGVILMPVFTTKKTDSDILIEAYALAKKHSATKIIICSKEFDKGALALSKQLEGVKIYLLNDRETYLNILKPTNTYPEIKVTLKYSSKITFSEFLNMAFNKSKTKSYVFMAIFLLLASLLIRYNLYYIISASVVMCFALFSYFNKEYNVIIQENVF